jgi:hypothetical protein
VTLGVLTVTVALTPHRGGNPIDLHMQQDAEEFLRLLCERLEEHLKGTEYVRMERGCS